MVCHVVWHVDVEGDASGAYGGAWVASGFRSGGVVTAAVDGYAEEEPPEEGCVDGDHASHDHRCHPIVVVGCRCDVVEYATSHQF